MGKFTKEIYAYAFKNSLDFGKADAGKVLPKLFQHGLEKGKIKDVIQEIQEVVKEVNSLSLDEKQKMFESYKEYVVEHEEKERELPELENANSKSVFRVAPFPSGALHIGNAKTYLLNALYAEKYGAKTLLVMDDTIGSEEKPLTKEAYKLIKDGLDWLDIKYEKKIVYKSDRLKIYYKYALELIKKDKAYVCHCTQGELKKNREKGIECGCRQFPVAIQEKRWKDMFVEKEGDAVLRIKTDMRHKNPAFRDRVLFKISDRKHPRVGNKYRIWPSLEMSWAVDDYELGITHILRGNDMMMEGEMENYIWDIFSWKKPRIYHTGLINIEGMGAKISKSKAQKEVNSGEFTGWDDPRTWSLQSLKRRGFKKESLREFVKEIGLNKQDITIPVDNLYAINRRLIDQEAERYSFVENPVKLEINNKPKLEGVFIPVHPDKEKTREIFINDLFISKQDFDSLKGQEIRLQHLFNIKLGKKIEYTDSENKDIKRINWVSESVVSRILMADGTWKMGLAESAVKNLKKGKVIQFERFGFCKFDGVKKSGKDEIYEFWFAHK